MVHSSLETEVTVTTHVSVNPPSTVVTVIVQEPTAAGVTTPEVLTVAIEELLLEYVTALFVALVGEIVGES